MATMSFLPGAITRHPIVTAASAAAVAFLGYCVYFDRKRRSAPDYKQKIRQNRRAQTKKATTRTMPNPHNPTEMQAFFLQEVQLGEELLADGNLNEGIDHLCNAITLCGQPAQLVQIFQQTLPPEHYALLIQKLPEAKMRLMRMFGSAARGLDESEQPGTSGLPGISSDAPRARVTGVAEGLIDSDDLE